jgi:hypothetical protein
LSLRWGDMVTSTGQETISVSVLLASWKMSLLTVQDVIHCQSSLAWSPHHQLGLCLALRPGLCRFSTALLPSLSSYSLWFYLSHDFSTLLSLSLSLIQHHSASSLCLSGKVSKGKSEQSTHQNVGQRLSRHQPTGHWPISRWLLWSGCLCLEWGACISPCNLCLRKSSEWTMGPQIIWHIVGSELDNDRSLVQPIYYSPGDWKMGYSEYSLLQNNNHWHSYFI